MSFICVICRDLLKTSEESSLSPRHNQYLSTNTGTPTHVSSSAGSNNVSGRKKEKNNSIVALKCGHIFHYSCLSVWMSQSMNLTTDSKMRCPSCKQLIYIYELVQLFPVENSCGGGCSNSNGLDNTLTTTFQFRLKCVLEQIEKLVRDLGKNINGSPMKGNETPTRLQRIRDSPKKFNATQLAEVVREFDSLKTSLKELSSVLGQHAELGSVVECQQKEISELKSKNEQLAAAVTNEKLKLETNVPGNTTMTVSATAATQHDTKTEPTAATATSPSPAAETDFVDIMNVKAQEVNVASAPPENSSSIISTKLPEKVLENKNAVGNGSAKESRRKSVTFLDPFEDDFDKTRFTSSTRNEIIPFHSKDLRIGDKVIWYFEGNPEVGTVKWKGFIGSQINVGVEFERQLGLPIKDHSTEAIQYIFKSKPGHGRLIPVNELVPYDKRLFTDSNDILTAFSYDPTECVHHPEYRNGISGNHSNGFNKRMQLCAQQ